MRNHLEAFERHLNDRRSQRTVKTYGAILQAFAGALGADDAIPTASDIEAFLSRPLQNGARRSPATRNQELAALRAYARWAMRELRWMTNPTADIPLARENPHDPVVLGVGEIRALFVAAAAEPDAWKRARGLALLALLSQVGLRVHELVALDLSQVDLVTNTLLAVRGKGGTVHDLPLNSAVGTMLKAWLSVRAARVLVEPDALLVSSAGTRLSIRSVQRFVAKLKRATNTAKKVSPHSFRHSVATLALTMGTDLATVGELLRHADLNSTRRYLGLIDLRRREAVGKLAVAVPAELVDELSSAEPSDEADQPALDVQANLDDHPSPHSRASQARRDGRPSPPARPSETRANAVVVERPSRRRELHLDPLG